MEPKCDLCLTPLVPGLIHTCPVQKRILEHTRLALSTLWPTAYIFGKDGPVWSGPGDEQEWFDWLRSCLEAACSGELHSIAIVRGTFPGL